jgi:hypothetical protein
LETANEARPIYKTGKLPVLLRMLAPINKQMRLPFSVTTFMCTHAATFLFSAPILFSPKFNGRNVDNQRKADRWG